MSDDATLHGRPADDNVPPDWAKITVDQLSETYAGEAKLGLELLAEARAFPTEVTDDELMGKGSDLVVRLRKFFDTMDSHREKEKAPHEVRFKATNNYFFGWMEKFKRRNKGDAAGAADIIYARVDAYNQIKLAREQAARRQAALDARKEADQFLAEAENAQRDHDEAARIAARARAPQHIETKTTAAQQLGALAQEAKVGAMLANDKAEVAEVHALAKPADLTRQRSDGGTMTTMGTETYAEIDGDDGDELLDKEKLWPFISRDAKEKALRAWAKTTGHNQKMAGAKIGRRPKTRIGG